MMLNLKGLVARIRKSQNEKGQGLVEYALILVLVAIVVIAVLLTLGPVVSDVFCQVTTALGGECTVGTGGITIVEVYPLPINNSPGSDVNVTIEGLPGVTYTISVQDPAFFNDGCISDMMGGGNQFRCRAASSSSSGSGTITGSGGSSGSFTWSL